MRPLRHHGFALEDCYVFAERVRKILTLVELFAGLDIESVSPQRVTLGAGKRRSEASCVRVRNFHSEWRRST